MSNVGYMAHRQKMLPYPWCSVSGSLSKDFSGLQNLLAKLYVCRP